jgi:hypothetical protein
MNIKAYEVPFSIKFAFKLLIYHGSYEELH